MSTAENPQVTGAPGNLDQPDTAVRAGMAGASGEPPHVDIPIESRIDVSLNTGGAEPVGPGRETGEPGRGGGGGEPAASAPGGGGPERTDGPEATASSASSDEAAVDAAADTGAVASVPVAAADVPGALEAILFVVDAPQGVATLAATLQQPVAVIEQALEELRAGYDARHAGIELREVAGGVRLYTRAEHAAAVEIFLRDGQRSRLTQAALETLAVIAYRQPVTRARVSAIRGVNVDGVMRTLLSRGLVVEVGADPDTGGGLYRTSALFLERLGLQSLEELPSLAPLLPELDGLEYDEL